jgi:hypothetical protein
MQAQWFDLSSQTRIRGPVFLGGSIAVVLVLAALVVGVLYGLVTRGLTPEIAVVIVFLIGGMLFALRKAVSQIGAIPRLVGTCGDRVLLKYRSNHIVSYRLQGESEGPQLVLIRNWERGFTRSGSTTRYFLAGESHGAGALLGVKDLPHIPIPEEAYRAILGEATRLGLSTEVSPHYHIGTLTGDWIRFQGP